MTTTTGSAARSVTAPREPASGRWIRDSLPVRSGRSSAGRRARAERRGRDRARATYLGNTYQAINSLPNIVYYQLLAGSLFPSILVPPIVERIDRGDRAGAEALARGFYGSLLAIAGVACIVLALAGPFILRVFTVGVADPASAALERKIGLFSSSCSSRRSCAT